MEWQPHQQMILVLADSSEDFHASVLCFEQNNHHWVLSKKKKYATIGANGLAWGEGMHEPTHSHHSIKKEGDKKSPMGIFAVESLFGHEKALTQFQSNLPYLAFTASMEAVDDIHSIWYNYIVDTNKTPIDWTSSEKLGQINAYKYGAVISYNREAPVPNLGSCIFMHIWQSPNRGTAGCIALSEENLLSILSWLDAKKHPVIAILPRDEYNDYQPLWNLPLIDE